MIARDRLVGLLADGKFHSGGALAAALGVTRSAVWKQIHRLGDLGLEVIVESGRGYRLAAPLELLARDAILETLDPQTRGACEQLEVVAILPSTSAALAEQPMPAPGMWRAVLAEFQTAGRARRGRRWLSPFGGGLCLSLSWCFASVPKDFPALSLAAGIAARRAIAATGSPALSLKWPNDVLINDAKLAGILVDVDGDARGPLRAIIGVGLNLSVPDGLVGAVVADGGLRPGSIDQCGPEVGQISRNELAARLIGGLFGILRAYPTQGFAPLADEWRRHDYLRGRPVTVSGGAQPISGVARGVAADGALLVEGRDGVAAVLGGEVTLRAAT
jgi:BirA family biotin operon repressor/biotin-[acetyl-CoA-carboxylase] ligase